MLIHFGKTSSVFKQKYAPNQAHFIQISSTRLSAGWQVCDCAIDRLATLLNDTANVHAFLDAAILCQAHLVISISLLSAVFLPVEV